MYQKKQYEPRTCEICGKIFVPKRFNIVTCADPECKRRSKLDKQNRWYRPKPDTIVAIGYAERQMQQSLEMAGKIKVTL